MPAARRAGRFWSMEFGLHALAAVVRLRALGADAQDLGEKGRRSATAFGWFSHQAVLTLSKPCRRSAARGDWPHQGRARHKAGGGGGRARSSSHSQFSSGSPTRPEGHRASRAGLARKARGWRQGLGAGTFRATLRRHRVRVLHFRPLQTSPAFPLSSRLLASGPFSGAPEPRLPTE